jgi:hypothetical protein
MDSKRLYNRKLSQSVKIQVRIEEYDGVVKYKCPVEEDDKCVSGL